MLRTANGCHPCRLPCICASAGDARINFIRGDPRPTVEPSGVVSIVNCFAVGVSPLTHDGFSLRDDKPMVLNQLGVMFLVGQPIGFGLSESQILGGKKETAISFPFLIARLIFLSMFLPLIAVQRQKDDVTHPYAADPTDSTRLRVMLIQVR